MKHVNEVLDDLFKREDMRRAERQAYRDGMYEVRRELGYEPDPEPEDDQEAA